MSNRLVSINIRIYYEWLDCALKDSIVKLEKEGSGR